MKIQNRHEEWRHCPIGDYFLFACFHACMHTNWEYMYVSNISNMQYRMYNHLFAGIGKCFKHFRPLAYWNCSIIKHFLTQSYPFKWPHARCYHYYMRYFVDLYIGYWLPGKSQTKIEIIAHIHTLRLCSMRIASIACTQLHSSYPECVFALYFSWI